MKTVDKIQAFALRIRDEAIDLMEEHDRLDHGGEWCGVERANLLGFLAHCLGMQSTGPDIHDVLDALRSWETRHAHDDQVERKH